MRWRENSPHPSEAGAMPFPLNPLSIRWRVERDRLSRVRPMGVHDEYGKQILRRATDGAVELIGPGVEVDYGTTSPARIDGVFGGRIAIEVEARTGKQVRGAVLDLVCHPYPKETAGVHVAEHVQGCSGAMPEHPGEVCVRAGLPDCCSGRRWGTSKAAERFQDCRRRFAETGGLSVAIVRIRSERLTTAAS